MRGTLPLFAAVMFFLNKSCLSIFLFLFLGSLVVATCCERPLSVVSVVTVLKLCNA